MDVDLRWIVGLSVTVVLALSGAFVAAIRNMGNQRQSDIKDIHRRIDDVRENYVRRDESAAQISRIDKHLQDLRAEMSNNHRQLLQAITNIMRE